MSDRRALLPENGNWYKANLHCHSTVSDGVYTPEEIKELYQNQGYSIVALTDHEFLVPHTELCDEHFLMLTSYEVQVCGDRDLPFNMRRVCHLNFYARDPGQRKMPFLNYDEVSRYDFSPPLSTLDYYGPQIERAYTVEGINHLIALGKERGFIVCWNHPTWSLEEASVYTHLEGLFGMEIFNTGAATTGYESYCPYIYDEMLRSGKRLGVVATDDTHRARDLFGGFTMMCAEELKYDQIIDCMEKGNYYASTGPLIHRFYVEDGFFHMECSPAKKIVLSNSGRRRWINSMRVAETELLTHAEFPVSEEDLYVRLTVTDECGRTANTRAYFREEFTDKPSTVPDILHRTIG